MKKATICHTCGHRSVIQVDNSVRSWLAFYVTQPCFVCQPTQPVQRLCGHTTDAQRGFYSPRRMESAAMQLCTDCRDK